MCIVRQKKRDFRVDSATVEELDLSIIHSRKVPRDASKKKKKPQAITMTLAWTCKILLFVFISCSSAKLHTEKKRPAEGWGHAIQWTMQMHIVGVLDMCSHTGKCASLPLMQCIMFF